MKRLIQWLFGGSTVSGHLEDPTERLIERLELDLAHERATNTKLLEIFGNSKVAILDSNMRTSSEPEQDYEAIHRGSRLLSQVKRRAMEVLERRKKEV